MKTSRVLDRSRGISECGRLTFLVGPQRRCHAFTLIEVMVALALFFMTVFVILDNTSQGLRAAKSLQLNRPDLTSAVHLLVMTNALEEGSYEGVFEEGYPDYRWRANVYEVATNGLFQVDVTISGGAQRQPYVAESSLLLWRPASRRPRVGLRR
jgi:Tfp pilus assembly protein PilV